MQSCWQSYVSAHNHQWNLLAVWDNFLKHFIFDATSCSHGFNLHNTTSKSHKSIRWGGPSEWKLPLRGRITCRHCRQPKLPNFFYSSNTTSWRLMRRANNNNMRRSIGPRSTGCSSISHRSMGLSSTGCRSIGPNEAELIVHLVVFSRCCMWINIHTKYINKSAR